MKKTLIGALFAVAVLAPVHFVNAADQAPNSDVVCTGRHPTKPGFICSDGTKISLDGVEFLEREKAPKFNISRKLLKVSTSIELQQCENGRDFTYCTEKPWVDIDFVSIENEADCVSKAHFISFEKWLRSSRQGFAPTVTWTCM